MGSHGEMGGTKDRSHGEVREAGMTGNHTEIGKTGQVLMVS